MFNDKANFCPSIMVEDVCGGKTINLKNVAPRKVKVVWCVIIG